MKRRDFLKAGPALSLPFLLNGFSLKAAATHPILQLLQAQTAANGRVLVLVQLSGGNDGLNTLIPLDQYSNLAKARANLLIPQDRVLSLSGFSQTGFHPSMTGMQGLYNSGQMNIVQAASYANPSFSHFRATDIWLTGSDADVELTTGWLGRTLQGMYPGFPDTYPDNPLAIEIGSQASLVTQCSTLNAAVTVTNPSSFYQLVNGIADPAPDTPYGHELTFIRLIKTQTEKYTDVIKNAFNSVADTGVNYPPNNSLGDQLKIVARLINGGLTTPVYVVSHPNTFDTHANQVDISDSTIGAHASNLATLSDAMNAFQQDLGARQIADQVVGMTVTEFGRRIKSNDSRGSDHGAATPIFFFGTGVNPTIVGTNPQIPDTVTVSDQVNMQYDFKQVYYTILKDWFQLPDDQIGAVFPASYTTLPIFKSLALPVTLGSFTGEWPASAVLLKWDVLQELNIQQYEVQRSDDGNSYIKIGTVAATNVASAHSYGFTDSTVTRPFYYYRLRIAEKSGDTQFSAVILLRSSQASDNHAVKIFPNPVDDRFTVSFNSRMNGLITVTLTDLGGREVWKDEKQLVDAYENTFYLNGKKPASGIYVVKLQGKQQELSAKIVIR